MVARQAAQNFFKTYCKDCHGGAKDVKERINVLNRDILLERFDPTEEEAYIVPRKPDKSRVWEYMGVPKYQMPKRALRNHRSRSGKLSINGSSTVPSFPRRSSARRSMTARPHRHARPSQEPAGR